MLPGRTYDDGCAAAHALDLVGERWALLVVRELLLGPKRFTDLRAGLPHASPNVLAQRLRGLEESGIVRRRRLPPPAASKMATFHLESPYEPRGDQPRAIAELTDGLARSERHQVLLSDKFQRAIDRAKRKAKIVTGPLLKTGSTSFDASNRSTMPSP